MKPLVSSAVGLTVAAMALSIPGLAQAAPTSTPSATPSVTATPKTTPSASATPTPEPTPSATVSAPPTSSAASSVASSRALAKPSIAAKYAASPWLGTAIGGEQEIAGGRKQAYTNGTIFWSPSTGAVIVLGSILAAYDAAGGPASALGFPTTDEHAGAHGSRVSEFTHGDIIWSRATGAHAVHGSILTEYKRLGREGGVLGKPVTSEFEGANARVVNFENGQIIWSRETGAHGVYGAIAVTYRALGHEGGVLGRPITSEQAGWGARVVTFERGQIVWSAETGGHAVHGSIFQTYTGTGREAGPLGRPTGGEFTARTGARVQMFTGGQIIFTPATGAHAVHGAIMARYARLGHENGPLGVPLTSEFEGAGARVQNFANGQIIFTRATGANSVQGQIAQQYAALGWERGVLGVPISDEFAGRGGARVNRFARGIMVWTGRTGAFAVHGAILTGYGIHGYEGGALGAPRSNEFPIAGGSAQDFEHGRLQWKDGRLDVVWPGPNVDARCRTGRVLCISKADRRLRWMVDGRVVTEMDARFGAAGTPTREGEFRVFSKVRDEVSYLYGNTPMPFAMYFSGGQAVHYSYDFARYGYGKTAFASHGCVNIRDYDGLRWLYDTQVRVGDRVVVYW